MTHKNIESNDSLNSSKEKSDDQKSPKTPLKNQHSSEHVIFFTFNISQILKNTYIFCCCREKKRITKRNLKMSLVPRKKRRREQMRNLYSC